MSHPPHGQPPHGPPPEGPPYGQPQGPPHPSPHYGQPPQGAPPYGPGAGQPYWGPPAPPGRSSAGPVLGVIVGAIVLVLVAAVGIVVLIVRTSQDSPQDSPPPAVSESEASGALTAIRDRGELIIGTVEGPPYSWLEGGQATGSAPEVALAVFAELGVTDHHAVTRADWNDLRDALQEGVVDVIAASWVYDPDLCRDHALAAPDGQHPSAFLVEAGNPEGVTHYTDIAEKDLTVGLVDGGPFMQHAEEAGVAEDQWVLDHHEPEAVIAALADGEIDAYASTTQWLRWMGEEFGGGDYEVTEPFTPEADGQEQPVYSGMVFASGQEELVAEVDAVLEQLRFDGRLLDIGAPFGVDEDNLPPEGLSAEQACAGV